MSELSSVNQTDSSIASILKTPKHFRGISELTFEEKIMKDIQTLPYLNLKSIKSTWDSISTAVLKKQFPSPESHFSIKLILPKYRKKKLQISKSKKSLSFNLDHFSHTTKLRTSKIKNVILTTNLKHFNGSNNFQDKMIRRRSCACNYCGQITSKQNIKLYLAPYYPNKAIQHYTSKSVQINMYQTTKFSQQINIKSKIKKNYDKKEILSNSMTKNSYEIKLSRADSWQEGVQPKRKYKNEPLEPLSESLNIKIDSILNNPMVAVIGIKVNISKRESDRVSFANLRSTFSYIYTPLKREKSVQSSSIQNQNSSKKTQNKFVLLQARHRHEESLKKNVIHKYINNKLFQLPLTVQCSPRQFLATSRDSMRSHFRSSGTVTPRAMKEIYMEKERQIKTKNNQKRPIMEFQRKIIIDASLIQKKFQPYVTKK